ncbi:MAG: hydrolase [Clostridiales bacterium 43-6]|nr:MAG: hydrolase [Clostridiales bacterium 43-6]
MTEPKAPEFQGNLRSFMLKVPDEIYNCSGIKIFGKRIKSVLFSTDVSIIRNTNADSVIAVYPFTPQPIITQAIMAAADIPVFAGVGGGRTQGKRVFNLALHAEHQGAIGVVLNAPTTNESVKEVCDHIDIPVVITVVSENDDIGARLAAGAHILNVSAAAKTVDIVKKIRAEYPDAAIIATGGPNDESIKRTIEAGANAITWTPPSNGDLFKAIMEAYRKGEKHP